MVAFLRKMGSEFQTWGAAILPFVSELQPSVLCQLQGIWAHGSIIRWRWQCILKTCNSAFYYLYNLKRVRKYLSKDNTKTLVHAFISSRIDYCNSLLYGLPEYQLNKLQRVQNMCDRLICNESKYCHITTLLVGLHWLSVNFRIEFKIYWLFLRFLGA